VLAKRLAACTHLSSTVTQLFEPQLQKIAVFKNRRFHVPQPTFLFPLETPLRLAPNMFHGWKDNSMLAKPLAACTYLSSIVSAAAPMTITDRLQRVLNAAARVVSDTKKFDQGLLS